MTLQVTLRERHELKVFENRTLMKIFKPQRDEIREGENKFIRRNFANFSYLQIQFRDGNNEAEKDETFGTHEVEFWFGNARK